MSNNNMKKRAILIAGPTASGKSGVAMVVAKKCDGVIVNADAMQVYAPLRVVTARPSLAAEAEVTHKLYGHVAAEEIYSVGRWLKDVTATLENIWREGRVAIITGGTGLYFKALENGLADLPDVPLEVREKWRGRLKQHGAQILHDTLAMHSPDEAQRINARDGQRLVRALEVIDATGRPLASFFDNVRPAVLGDAEVTRLALLPGRVELYERCHIRFDAMINAGALAEVEALVALGLNNDLPIMKAIGVRALAAHICGELSLDMTIDQAQRETRNYAKRQMTWVRGQMGDWYKAGSEEEALKVLL